MLLNLVVMTSLYSRNCVSMLQKKKRTATSLFFLLVFLSLVRFVIQVDWNHLQMLYQKTFLLTNYTDFWDRFFFRCCYIHRLNQILISFFCPSLCFLIYCQKKKRVRSSAFRHMIQPKGCAIIWKFTLVTVPMVVSHTYKKKRMERRETQAVNIRFYGFIHSSPVVNYKADLVNMYEVEKKRWIFIFFFFFSVCPLWKLQ